MSSSRSFASLVLVSDIVHRFTRNCLSFALSFQTGTLVMIFKSFFGGSRFKILTFVKFVKATHLQNTEYRTNTFQGVIFHNFGVFHSP